jgi:polyribonucleotide nucleotidyltransferase
MTQPTIKTMDLQGRSLSIETGLVAKQAGGSVMVRLGESVVLVTAVGSKEAREGQNFFPLTCEYRPRFYSAGKIPGSFFRREARPDEVDTISARLMDRPIRPLFPKGFLNEVQVMAMVLSFDLENETDVLAILGASASLMLSGIPFEGPVGAVRVGRVDGSLVAFPTLSQLAESDLNIVVAATEEAIVMVEGLMDEISEDHLIDALEFAHEQIKPQLAAQKELAAECGRERWTVDVPAEDQELPTKVAGLADPRIGACFGIEGKHERADAFRAARDEVVAECTAGLAEAEAAEVASAVKELYEKRLKALMRDRLLSEGKRIDGRAPATIRDLDIRVGVLPRTHGSALFTRGETQALVVATLGTRDDEQRLDRLTGMEFRRFMLHYNFPSFSVGEVRRIGGPGRREIGHGTLARRAVLGQIPEHEDFPYTLRVVADILESNGSSSMASVCGASLALMDAGVPMKNPVAGIAMGLVKEGDRYAVLTDISGAEDHMGDMDFKVCGTAGGVTAFQMDTKIGGISRTIMQEALAQAREARMQLLNAMGAVLAEPRSDLSPFAPRIESLQINPDRIGALIGPGGKVIRGIQESTGVKIDVSDDGTVNVASADAQAVEKARKMIAEILQEAEPGKIYLGLVKKVVDFGAFVEIFPGTEGLLHISQLAHERVAKVEDVLVEGDEVLVKCLEVDKSGKIRLSRKAALGQDNDGARA